MSSDKGQKFDFNPSVVINNDSSPCNKGSLIRFHKMECDFRFSRENEHKLINGLNHKNALKIKAFLWFSPFRVLLLCTVDEHFASLYCCCIAVSKTFGVHIVVCITAGVVVIFKIMVKTGDTCCTETCLCKSS